MGEKPRLPPVSTLLKMTDMDDFSSSHRNDRRSHRSSNHFDGGHLSASFTHHRGRSPASPMEIDHPSSSSSRSRRQDAPSRGSASGSKSTIHSHRGGHLLPSVSEVLGSARDSRGNEWPPSTMHERGSASGSRSMQVPPPVVEVPSHGHGGHPCERCGRMFTRKSDAIKHKRVVHDKVKTFTCRECGRKFARKDYCTVSFPSRLLFLCF